jgi:hypothetical protein
VVSVSRTRKRRGGREEDIRASSGLSKIYERNVFQRRSQEGILLLFKNNKDAGERVSYPRLIRERVVEGLKKEDCGQALRPQQ